MLVYLRVTCWLRSYLKPAVTAWIDSSQAMRFDPYSADNPIACVPFTPGIPGVRRFSTTSGGWFHIQKGFAQDWQIPSQKAGGTNSCSNSWLFWGHSTPKSFALISEPFTQLQHTFSTSFWRVFQLFPRPLRLRKLCLDPKHYPALPTLISRKIQDI